MKNVTKQKGFTIIEVVLVLAIAGLIFLMVFIALPALQRSQADTARRQDVGKLTSEITTYQTNNRGAVPDFANNKPSFATFRTQYLDGSFTDPTGPAYTIVYTPPTQVGQIQYQLGATCDSTSDNGYKSAGARQVAAIIYLSSGATFCANN